jgi:hypothetical protein
MMRMTLAVAVLIVVVTAMLPSRSASIERSAAAKPPLEELHPMLPTEFGSLNSSQFAWYRRSYRQILVTAGPVRSACSLTQRSSLGKSHFAFVRSTASGQSADFRMASGPGELEQFPK